MKHFLNGSACTVHKVKLVLVVLAATLFSAACAPITPLPGPSTNLPIPTPGGLPGGASPAPVPGMPGPSPSPGGQPGGQSGGQPGGQPSSQGGSPSGQSGGDQQSGGGGSAGGTPSSYDPPPGGGSSIPGGTTPGIPGGTTPGQGSSGSGSGGGGGGNEAEAGWEDVPGGSDEGDWETSNEELPEENQGSGGSSSSGGDAGDVQGGDGELDEVLKDFDGEILSEREVINSTPSQGASTSILIPTEDEDVLSHDGGGNTSAPSTSQPPRKKAIPNAPAPPRRGAELMPDDIPDAKDDDIIARQLREAAMQEDDPQLKEKLWEEYRKYKNS